MLGPDQDLLSNYEMQIFQMYLCGNYLLMVRVLKQIRDNLPSNLIDIMKSDPRRNRLKCVSLFTILKKTFKSSTQNFSDFSIGVDIQWVKIYLIYLV